MQHMRSTHYFRAHMYLLQIYKTKTKVQNKGSLLVFTAAPTEWGLLLSESQNYPGDSAESKINLTSGAAHSYARSPPFRLIGVE